MSMRPNLSGAGPRRARSGSRTTLFNQLWRREFKSRYLGNVGGLIWALLHPLALLAIYGFVFVVIFKARVPEADTTGFLPYLAVAFWPWIAFSESLLKATTAVTDNSAVLGKVALPVEYLVLASVAATFALQVLGYAAVLLTLALAGVELHWPGLGGVASILVLLFLFTCALALISAALQVFLRDWAQVLTPLLTLWFFATPIIYSISLVPERYQFWFSFNPMFWFVRALRECLLGNGWILGWGDLAAAAGILMLLGAGYRFFTRCAGHFEDYL